MRKLSVTRVLIKKPTKINLLRERLVWCLHQHILFLQILRVETEPKHLSDQRQKQCSEQAHVFHLMFAKAGKDPYIQPKYTLNNNNKKMKKIKNPLRS